MSDYKRLTKRFINSQMQQDVQLNETVSNGIFRLAELEDMIEQNVLIKLPCKVGDTVYHISSKTIHAEVVTEVRCEITNGKIDLLNSRIFTLDIYDKDDNFYRFSKLGVSLFLTKAEAEAELAKIRGQK